MLRLLLCLLLSLSLHGLCAGLLRESLAQAGEAHSEALAQVVQLISLAPLAAPAPAASKPMLAALPPSLAPSPSPPALAPVKVRLAPKPLPAARQARRPNEPAPPAAAVASARSSAPAALSAGTVPAEVRAPVVAAAAATAVAAEVLSHKPSFAQAPPAPRYPAQARRRNQQGVVLLEVRLDARGQQRELKLLRSSGVSSLDQAALAAVSQWRFRAEVRDGQSVPSRVQIPIEFALTATR